MKMNYNAWFYAFHNYLTGNRDGIIGYNDTSVADIGDRYRQLIEMKQHENDPENSLFTKQPYGMLGNTTGFAQLLSLLSQSSYSFEDIDDALKKTYDQSLRRAMGKMMVNTHAVIFHATNINDKHIHNETLTSYFNVDIPYDQLHFGERDEFIRQKLHKMHDSVNERFIHVSEFTNSPFMKILGCTFMMTINGMICNEFYAGFDDHGFRFRFGYGGVADADILIFKLDDTAITQHTFVRTALKKAPDGKYKLPLNLSKGQGHKCIVDIYDRRFQKSMQVAPNFGWIDDDGQLVIESLQKPTLEMFNRYKPIEVNVIIYHPKFFHELNGVYPALNYMHLTKLTPIYTDLENKVVDIDNLEILATPIKKDKIQNIQICTPPICIDRECDLHFDIILKCINLYEEMMEYKSVVSRVEAGIQHFFNVLDNSFRTSKFKIETPTDYTTATDAQKKSISELKNILLGEIVVYLTELNSGTFQYYMAYVNGAMLTNVVDEKLVKKFTRFYQDMHTLQRIGAALNVLEQIDAGTDIEYDEDYLNEQIEYANKMLNQFGEFLNDGFYVDGYEDMVLELVSPYLASKQLSVFQELSKINLDFFEKESSHRFNRPISEQCFIPMKYSREFQCWIFAYPEIKHFHGIENSFYVNTGLKGDEVFKFFFLYTDTFYPSAKEIDDTFAIETVLDYDKFITEVENYLGFIRYWNLENKLMRMSKILYNKYDDESVVHVLSDILKHNVDPTDILVKYGSNFTYLDLNYTTDNYQDYDEDSFRAPFAVNYLFYILALLKDNEDALLTFFYQTLTDEKFNPRYLEYNVSEATSKQQKILMNFGTFTKLEVTNNMLLSSPSVPITDNKINFYYGIPGPIKNGTVYDTDVYPYTFVKHNQLEDGSMPKFPLYKRGHADDSHYIQFDEPIEPFCYYYDIQFAKLLTKFLTAIRDFIGYFQTDYKHAWNQSIAVETGYKSIRKIREMIQEFYDTTYKEKPNHIEESFIKTHVLNGDPFSNLMDSFYVRYTNKIDRILRAGVLVRPYQKRLVNSKPQMTYYEMNEDGSYQAKKKLLRAYAGIYNMLYGLKMVYYEYGFRAPVIRRARNLYLHFKELAKTQNVYQFKQLVNIHQFDQDFLSMINHGVSHSDIEQKNSDTGVRMDPYDENGAIGGLFAPYTIINEFNIMATTEFPQLQELNALIDEYKESYLKPIEEYVDYVMKHYVTDLYIIERINDPYMGDHTYHPYEIEGTGRDDIKYAKAVITIDEINMKHFCPPGETLPIGSTITLYFNVNSGKLISTNETNGNKINQLYVPTTNRFIQHCQYVFFGNDALFGSNDPKYYDLQSYSSLNVAFTYYDENGNAHDAMNGHSCEFLFRKVGSTADLVPDMEILLNGNSTVVSLQNVHENITVDDSTGCTINRKVTSTNYEMYIGNRYTQLLHTYEFQLQPKTYLPGPVDIVRIPNHVLNEMMLSELGDHVSAQMFFKPSQILHLPLDDDKHIQSVGGKYFEGQKIYLMTNDQLHYVFPAEITAIDHSVEHGFVEAKVDNRHAKWLEITDQELMSHYLTDNVECIVLKDNISNLLDEYTNPNYETYANPTFDPDVIESDIDYQNMRSFPGDPIKSTVNKLNYTYTRVNGFLPETWNNRYPGEEYKRWRFIYLGEGAIREKIQLGVNQTTTKIRVITWNRNRCELSEPELYPVLRDEPNDHDVYALERHVYQNEIDNAELELQNYDIEELHNMLFDDNLSESERHKIQRQLANRMAKITKLEKYRDRVKEYLDEQEHKTTWYNVLSYDAAKTYISNTRTKLPDTFKPDIRDIMVNTSNLLEQDAPDNNHQLKFFVYDMDHQEWLDPNIYQIRYGVVANENLDVYDDYVVEKALKNIELRVDELHVDEFPISNHLLIYMAYEKSNIYNRIVITDERRKCLVKFKPILSTNDSLYDNPNEVKKDVYKDLTIRKHLDLYEDYGDKSYTTREDFGGFTSEGAYGLGSGNAIYIDRRPLLKSGRSPYTPTPRFCHLDLSKITTTNPDGVKIDDCLIYIKAPFDAMIPIDPSHTRPIAYLNIPKYEVNVIESIDNFKNGEVVKLICFQYTTFDDTSGDVIVTKYDGNISNMMFEGVLVANEDGSQGVQIRNTTYDIQFQHGIYKCYIAHDSDYHPIGGLISVTITRNLRSMIDKKKQWIGLYGAEAKYIEIPPEFWIGPANATDWYGVGQYHITLDVAYKKIDGDRDFRISKNNSDTLDPFRYYWNWDMNIRFPISSTRHNRFNERLTFPEGHSDDETENRNNYKNRTRVVRSNYISVCRYSLANIPKNGLIDVTGFVPTPLSRDRYEWWVNGRQLKGDDHLIILSPTSFQLINLTSLKNFELIELVDDKDVLYDNSVGSNQWFGLNTNHPLFTKGNVYIDLYGNVYTSYDEAIRSGHTFLEQHLRFRYNGPPNHTPLQNSTMGYITNPNNNNIEQDIMDFFPKYEERHPSNNYNDYYNIPLINGVPLYHLFTDDIGLHEIENTKILDALDDAWKYERITNPLFPTTHRDDSMIIEQQYLLIHVKEDFNKYVIYTTGTYSRYFTIYLTEHQWEEMDHAKMIIPIIRTGTRIELPKSVKGLWVHATVVTCIQKEIK